MVGIKGGDLLHVANQVLLDRLQTGGPGQLNIPTDKIYELGNYQSVGQILDIPDLSYPLESFDASAELEAMLVGKNFASDTAGTEYDISKAIPLDIAAQFKAGKNAVAPFNVETGVAIPHLTLEQLSYRFGVSDNAQQSCTLRGDSIFYTPGSVYIQEATGTATPGQAVTLAHGAYPYNGDIVSGTRYALGVSLSTGERLVYGVDYTEDFTAAGGVGTGDVIITKAVPNTAKIRVMYSSDTPATYNQASHAVASATRPAAIRGRHIKVFVGGTDLTDAWTGVQQFTVDYRVQLQRDLEFGNSNIVDQDYDVPDVSGSVTLLPRSATDLYNKIKQIAGADDGEVVGALQQAVLPIDIVLYSPVDGTVLKTLSVEDARFTVPGFSGRVQQKLTVDVNFSSDTGNFKVYKGARS